ncbi:MAG: IS1380 family transposase [Acidobacteria bacterium]|nr:IS1380 family transposase [Candidatus Sulfomarinibacter sp. MAG AM2]
MHTQCNPEQLEFQGLGTRKVVADFSGGRITSDAGSLLLREVEEGTGILRSFAACFVDYRVPESVEHSVPELVAQRVYAIALGYEDINDHDELRRDALLATLVGKTDPTGADRLRERDRGFPLAGKSTLNRLELAPADTAPTHRYHRIACRPEAVDRFFVDTFLDAYPKPQKRIILDFDATDDPLHGEQEGRFFHGYYGCYCYLPLYVFCDDHLLCARLRPSNIDAAKGSLEELERIVGQIRERWSDVQIIVRGDSGFARDDLMTWCEENGVDFIFGLARNNRLVKKIAKQLKRAKKRFWKTGRAARCYRDFRYRTLKSWSRTRRVVGKAEQLSKGENPRFVVSSLSKEEFTAQALYEDLYCARGDMENRIKEQQLGLFADRTSSTAFSANQLRLWFSSVAYVLLSELRRVGLAGTELARAQCSTIRTKLLKVGAHVLLSVRRIWVRCASGYPYQRIFAKILANLRAHYVPLRI